MIPGNQLHHNKQWILAPSMTVLIKPLASGAQSYGTHHHHHCGRRHHHQISEVSHVTGRKGFGVRGKREIDPASYEIVFVAYSKACCGARAEPHAQ
jgi:hypothetical protein